MINFQSPLRELAPEAQEIENLAFSSYCSHQSKIDAFIKETIIRGCSSDAENQYEICEDLNINPNELTSSDIEYIEKTINDYLKER